MFRANKHLFIFFSFIVLSFKQYCSDASMPNSLAVSPAAGFARETPGLNIPPLNFHALSSCAASSIGSRSQTPDIRVTHGKENCTDGVNGQRRQFTMQFNKIAGPVPFVETEEAAQGVCDQLRGLHDKFPEFIKHRIYERERNDKTRQDHYGDLVEYLAEKAQENGWKLNLPPSS